MFSFFNRVDKNKPKAIHASGVLAFFEPSTRTKLSFQKAGIDLGIDWMDLASGGLSLEKGESFEDTFKTIALYKPDFFVVRHSTSGFAHLVHHWTGLPVLNAGDGQRDHPTQGLLDAYTLWKTARNKKYKIAFIGDLARSRVARADIHLFRLLGHSLSIVDDGQSETALFAKAYRVGLVSRKSLKKFDIVVSLRVQKERGSHAFHAPLSADELLPRQYLMHPGPVLQGVDLSFELCDFSRENCLVHQQVANGLKVRTQLLSELVLSRKTK